MSVYISSLIKTEPLNFAVICTEWEFDRAKVWDSKGFYGLREKYQVVIDVSTDVGEFIAAAFSTLIIGRLSENKFTIDRVEVP